MPTHIERLAAGHKELLGSFTCSKTFGADHLSRFLHEKAWPEQEQLCNTTYVVRSDDGNRIDAYVTLSTRTVGLPQPWRKKHNSPRSEVPAMFIGYVAVHDDLLGKGVGLDILAWVKARAFAMNQFIGMRVLFLEVQAGNWGAFRQYAQKWGFVAIPLKATEANPTVRQPNADSPSRPDNIEADEMIGMFYDLYNEFGAYIAPSELGLADG